MLDQAVRKLGRNLDDAIQKATYLLSQAEELEIERAIRTLQVIKGKTYAKALLKENGKILNDVSFDIGIGLMLRKNRMTHAELELWFEEAEKKRFEGHIFQPLPDKADAWSLFQVVRQKLTPMSFAAQDLLSIHQRQLLPQPSTRITRKAAKTAIELGMWNLLDGKLRQEVFSVLDWNELPKALRLEFFASPSQTQKAEIMVLRGPMAREKATSEAYALLYRQNRQDITAAPAAKPPLATDQYRHRGPLFSEAPLPHHPACGSAPGGSKS
jgi:hypothetical protein